MESKVVFVLAFSYFTLVHSNVFSAAEDKEDLDTLLKVLSKPRKLDRHKPVYNEVSISLNQPTNLAVNTHVCDDR